MSIASFDEENQLVRQTGSTPAELVRGMSGWLVRKGFAANQNSADLTLVMLFGLLVFFSISAYFVLRPSPGADKHVPSPDALQTMQGAGRSL